MEPYIEMTAQTFCLVAKSTAILLGIYPRKVMGNTELKHGGKDLIYSAGLLPITHGVIKYKSYEIKILGTYDPKTYQDICQKYKKKKKTIDNAGNNYTIDVPSDPCDVVKIIDKHTYCYFHNLFFKFTLIELRQILYLLSSYATKQITNVNSTYVNYFDTLSHVKLAIKFIEKDLYKESDRNSVKSNGNLVKSDRNLVKSNGNSIESNEILVESNENLEDNTYYINRLTAISRERDKLQAELNTIKADLKQS